MRLTGVIRCDHAGITGVPSQRRRRVLQIDPHPPWSCRRPCTSMQTNITFILNERTLGLLSVSILSLRLRLAVESVFIG
jgi:hypothetical protein